MDSNMPTEETELFVFDVDGTVAPSKQAMQADMVSTMLKLLEKKKVAMIGGNPPYVYQRQFAGIIGSSSPYLKNFYLFPTCGAQFFIYESGEWKRVYGHDLSEAEKAKIKTALESAVKESGVEMPTKVYGEVIEDRGTQISISPFGQDAPLDVKKDWDLDRAKRQKIKTVLDRLIPEFEVRIGGTTTIDITEKGIDKAYGVEMMREHLGIPIGKMFFMGDALYPGGNDEAVIKTGIRTHAVKNEEETREFLEKIIPALD